MNLASDLVLLYWDFVRARSTFVFVREFWQIRTELLVTSKRLKFGLNIRINKSVLCTNFEGRRSRDRELKTKKNIKKWRFLA